MKYLLILLFVKNLLLGCATCTLMQPTANVIVELKSEEKVLKIVHIEWVFSKDYYDTLKVQYDNNSNNILDIDEQILIKDAMVDYLFKVDMDTKITFATNIKETAKEVKTHSKNFGLNLNEEILTFSYELNTNLAITKESLITILFRDDLDFFTFKIKELIFLSEHLKHEANIYLHTANIVFKEAIGLESSKLSMTPESQNVNNEPIDIKPKQEGLLVEALAKIRELFESIKDESNPISYITLLIFAYIYGVIHALGPGHGKTLVASYFLSNERSYSKALFVSLAIGVVHAFSAFILTLIIYFGVETFFSQFIQDSVNLTTKLSAFIIILIAIYLIYKKYSAYKLLEKQKNLPFSKINNNPHQSICGCSSCKIEDDSTDFALILSAGIIPCPGTTTIFIFATSLGLYVAGFLSALVMSTIIYVSALISVSVRRRNSGVQKILEYGSLTFILIFGISLFWF
jgi:nickel/cobalt transporter (NicO) family protein